MDHGWMDGWMDGWIDGWMANQVIPWFGYNETNEGFCMK